MREIINPWIDIKEYNCFGCSPKNPVGARMRFFEEDEKQDTDIVCVWHPTQNHQSWINTLHGGMQATLLDEICGWVIFRKLRTSGVTAKMEIRYRNAVSTTEGVLILRARLKESRHRVAVVVGEIRNKENKILAECECTYFTFDDNKAKEMRYIEPTLAEKEVDMEELITTIEQTQFRPIKIQ